MALTNFRSYRHLDLRLDERSEKRLTILCGDNGAGKTNVLEAISLFAQGRGLRRADLRACARLGGDRSFSIAATLWDEDYGEHRLGAGLDAAGARKIHIDGAPVSSARGYSEFVRIIWLTPAMDGLFMGSPGERRRFLDRLVLAVDAGHGARANAYERAARNRNRLLEMNARPAWMDAAEREIAELGVAMIAARQETVARLGALISAERCDASPFPYAELALDGEIERLTRGLSALEAEEAFRAALAASRARDAAAGRMLIGPQASDLLVRHGPKDMEARASSTGEQKALLTGLVLAHARLTALMSGIAPIMLLDEIGAHFDPSRRAALFDALERGGAQAWLTGTDPDMFRGLRGRAQFFKVADSQMSSL